MGIWFWLLLGSVIFLPTLGCIFASAAFHYWGVASLAVWVGLFLWAGWEYATWKKHDDGQL